jgi:hypothetical protein
MSKTDTAALSLPAWPTRLRGPITARWFRRTVVSALAFCAIVVIGPWVLGFSGAWRAFFAGLVVPGSGLLYAVPPSHHHVGVAMATGHAIVIAAEAGALALLLRRYRVGAALGLAAVVALLVIGVITAPTVVVVTGHVVGFLGVLIASAWAFAFRCIARSDYVTLPVIVLASAVVGAGLVSYHGDMPGPLTWVPWAALGLVVVVTASVIVREQIRHRRALRVGAKRESQLRERSAAQTNPVPLRQPSGAPEVVEASAEQLGLLRYLMSVAMQPRDSWSAFDAEGAGPLQQYRYQINALGWALAMYGYTHAPALRGPLHDAQLNLFARAQDKAVWGYWYWENLLGNWDLRRRGGDPVDVAQNIMFTGYLNLQLAMFRQATGDTRFSDAGSLEFRSSPTRSVSYDQDSLNRIVIRNFGGELCLWPCEPLPLGRSRTRGLVFPYCNTVSVAGVAVTDALSGSNFAPDIASRLRQKLDSEFTAADGDIVTFTTSGLGVTARGFRGPTTTAGILAFAAPLLPEHAWRAWEILRLEWLETGQYLKPGSGGAESPTAEDWGSGARTNAEPLAAAMLLAQECGDTSWHASLWQAAVDQLGFPEDPRQPGVRSFQAASLHANGMIGLGGFGRPYALADMMTKPRPEQWEQGPRIADLSHPDVLVAKAVSDGLGLSAVLHPGRGEGRFRLVLDQLRPEQSYLPHGAVESEIHADAHGVAQLTVDLNQRTTIELRPR